MANAKRKDVVEEAALKLAYAMDYPVDALYDTPSIHVTGRNQLTVEGCRGIRQFVEGRITLDMGKFSVTVHGVNIQLGNLSKTELTITGKISTVTWDDRGDSGI